MNETRPRRWFIFRTPRTPTFRAQMASAATIACASIATLVFADPSRTQATTTTTSAGTTPATATATTTVIVPGAILMADGTLAEGKAVAFREGAIVAIDDASAHAGKTDREGVFHRPGTVLSPGLIDPYSALGVYGVNVERVHAIDPQLNVIDAIDPWETVWTEALAAGVTTVMIVPGPNNVVGGMTAVIRTGSERRRPEVLRDQAMLLFSFGTPALDQRRAPTSRGGAISMLRYAFTEARDGRGDARLAALLDGTIAPIVRADAGEDVMAALRFFEPYAIGPVIVHTDELMDVIDDLVDAKVPVIVGPYALDTTPYALAAPGRLAKRGVEIAFSGNTPLREAGTLRLGAALAVRAGMDSAAARRGLTITPARILGVDEKVGALVVGHDADLVLFSGDPLRPDARVLEVYLRGVLVHVSPHRSEEIAVFDDEEVGEGATGETDDAME